MQNTQYRVRRALKRLLVIVGCITLLAGCEPNTRPQQSQTSAPAPILEPSPTLEANPTPESISASKPKPTPEPLVINLDLTTAQYNDQVTPEAVAQAPAAPTEVSVIVIEADMQETLQPTQDQVQVQVQEQDQTTQQPITEENAATEDTAPVVNNEVVPEMTRLARQEQLLYLANSMLEKGYVDLSLSLLQEIDMTLLPPASLGPYLEGMATSHLRKGDSFTALEWLHKASILAPVTSPASKHKRLTLLQQAYHQNEQFLQAALTAIELAANQQQATQEKEQRLNNNDYIWALLMQTPKMQLQTRLQSPLSVTAKAWLELALDIDSLITLGQQQQAIRKWQSANPLHPASIHLPRALSNLPDFGAQQAQKLALLLPTSGPHGKLGQAVIDGFMANYYQAIAQCPAPCTQTPHLMFINSHEVNDWPALFAQLEEQQVELVIGPLAKDKVDSLNTYQARRIPTLALNYLSADENQPSLANMADVDVRIQQHVARIDKPASANYIATQTTENPSQHTFFQFGLSLEDEARQLATQGHHQGLKQALIIHANTQWAQRVSDTFTQQWQHLGGKIAAKVSYTGNGDYADSISKVLLIDNSKQRRRDLQKLINNNVKFESRRRQDIDLIVLLGMPKDVRQLMPTLAFHHAAEVAVFATHHAYQGPTKTTRDRDLNKMYISDIPWMLEPDEVTHQVQATWPDRQRYSRLFALGADAYRLYPRLQQMQAFDATRVRGTTGLLKLDANNRITANLSWARFRNGQPVVRKGAHELQ